MCEVVIQKRLNLPILGNWTYFQVFVDYFISSGRTPWIYIFWASIHWSEKFSVIETKEMFTTKEIF